MTYSSGCPRLQFFEKISKEERRRVSLDNTGPIEVNAEEKPKVEMGEALERTLRELSNPDMTQQPLCIVYRPRCCSTEIGAYPPVASIHRKRRKGSSQTFKRLPYCL